MIQKREREKVRKSDNAENNNNQKKTCLSCSEEHKV